MIQVRAFLSSISGLVILALVIGLAIQTVRIDGLRLGPIGFDGCSDKLESARDELEKLSTIVDRQKPITERKVEQATEGRKQAERIKDRIIAAPPTTNCETPPVILGADL